MLLTQNMNQKKRGSLNNEKLLMQQRTSGYTTD